MLYILSPSNISQMTEEYKQVLLEDRMAAEGIA